MKNTAILILFVLILTVSANAQTSVDKETVQRAAVFDKKYQSQSKGKTFIEIPEVYELVNIAIAITPAGRETRGMVFQNSDYYQKVRRWFDKYQSNPLVSALDAEIKKTPGAKITPS